MNTNDAHFFELLKKEVAKTFLQNNTASSPEIKNWKGEDITSFQEDLFDKVNARVSEKWFYTYFKNTSEKLPRIDMLNLLSVYVGVENWNAFQQKNQKKSSASKFPKKLLWLVSLVFCFLFFKNIFKPKNQFDFCFVDAIKNEAITKTRLDIAVLQKDESPLYFKTDSLGCFHYESKEERITFVVQSPYHKTDTITRSIVSQKNTTVKIATDDYALMLDYYMNGNIKDWKKHKKELYKIIDNNAQIYRLFGDQIGVEIYTKDDFIRLSTTPTSVLKRIKILDKQMQGQKIVKLKFIVI